VYFIFGLTLVGLSCCKDEFSLSSNNEIVLNVQTNAARFEELIDNRLGDPYDITNFVREGDLLKINVSGGSEINTFLVVWGGLTNPRWVRWWCYNPNFINLSSDCHLGAFILVKYKLSIHIENENNGINSHSFCHHFSRLLYQK
jgi:hypothetical protein